MLRARWKATTSSWRSVSAECCGSRAAGRATHRGGAEATTSICPTQWEGTLEDGRTLFAHCRRGELSVGLGDSVNDAIDNIAADKALCFEYVEHGPMRLAQLPAHLYGLAPEDTPDSEG